MPAIKSQHSRVFEQLVAAHRQKLVDSVVSGLHGIESYWQLTGTIRGLDAALKMSEEADFKLSGDFDAGS